MAASMYAIAAGSFHEISTTQRRFGNKSRPIRAWKSMAKWSVSHDDEASFTPGDEASFTPK
jgi:hypothetical protein